MDTMQSLLTRQACRAYQSQQIDEADKLALLEAANAAPAALGQYENLHLCCIQDSAIIGALEEAAAAALPALGEHPAYGAPTVFLINARPQDGAQAPLPYCNASCVAENIMIEAAALGLGSVYLFALPAVMREQPDLCAIAQVPDDMIPVVMVAVGLPAQPLQARPVTIERIKTTFIG